MELYQIHYKKAADFFRAADHLIYVTMPVVQDVKIIVTVLGNINLALLHGMDAVLEYERYYKRVLPLATSFDMRFDVFKKRVVGRNGFSNQEAELIAEIKTLVDKRKGASMEFTRSGKFIICSEDYNMKTLSLEEIKKYLSTTKTFLVKVNGMIKN